MLVATLICNAAAAFGPPHTCNVRRAAVPLMSAAAPPTAPLPPTAPAVDDWGGLPGAVKASKCGAINNQMVNAADTDTILSLVVDNYKTLNGVNVATAMHHLARLTKFKRAERDAVLRDPRYLKLLDGTVERVAECNARSIADILWSCGTMTEFPPILLKPVLTQVAKYLEVGGFEPQHLSIMVWSFATLGVKPVKLLEGIEARALEQLKGFNTQNCANILQACTRHARPISCDTHGMAEPPPPPSLPPPFHIVRVLRSSSTRRATSSQRSQACCCRTASWSSANPSRWQTSPSPWRCSTTARCRRARRRRC